jgi:hypothetical protein
MNKKNSDIQVSTMLPWIRNSSVNNAPLDPKILILSKSPEVTTLHCIISRTHGTNHRSIENSGSLLPPVDKQNA